MSGHLGLYPASLGVEPIRRYTSALVDIVARHPASTPVATAGHWTIADLCRHVTEVQDFWAWIVANRPAGPESRPSDSDQGSDPVSPAMPAIEMSGDLLAANQRLIGELEAAAPDEPAWSWHPEHQSVAFTVRRQTHEALIHCYDASLAFPEEPWPAVPPELAADGVDELLTEMAGGVPGWARYEGSEVRVSIEAADTGDSWQLEFGTLTGTSPSGTDYVDLDTTKQLDGSKRSAAIVKAPALLLDLWAWGRLPLEELSVSGDGAVVRRLRTLIAESTQ